MARTGTPPREKARVYRTGRPDRLSQLLFAVAALILCAGIGAVLWHEWQGTRPTAAEQAEADEIERADGGEEEIAAVTEEAADGKIVVAIDPGHGGVNPSVGGEDAGSLGSGLREADVTLKTATLVYDKLARDGRFAPMLTANGTEYLKPSRRAARAEAQSIIDDARRTSNEVADELKQLRKQLRENADVQGTNAKQTELRRRLNEAEDRLAGHDDTPKPRPQAARAIRVGDTVELVRFGTRASVLAINKDGSYLLQAGIMKVTAQPDEVYLIEETKQQAKKIIERSQRAFRSAGASTELDLRGMSADEAIATLDIFLDNAMMANLASVRIIHGKGTGVLRKAVQDELKRNRCVKRYRLGVYGEGEDGVTIAELA